MLTVYTTNTTNTTLDIPISPWVRGVAAGNAMAIFNWRTTGNIETAPDQRDPIDDLKDLIRECEDE